MARSKHSPEFRAMVSQEYIDGLGSVHVLANKYGIGYSTLRGWIYEYRIHGISAFCHTTNRTYSREFKIKCVEAVMNGEGSVNDIVAQYGISSRSVLRKWIKAYNANQVLKDYDPKPEIYQAEARRKTTFEERKEIVGYCINKGRDYKDAAAKHNVSYSQVYSWVKKYDAHGEAGLIDKRACHKTDDDVRRTEILKSYKGT